jgi:hypothetical protein
LEGGTSTTGISGGNGNLIRERTCPYERKNNMRVRESKSDMSVRLRERERERERERDKGSKIRVRSDD